MIGMVFTNTNALVTPYNGSTVVFGTNAIAISAPGEGEDLFLLDMATSQTSFSKVMINRANNHPLEVGWATDGSGAPTLSPAEAVFLSPLGGYKGQGLAMAVQILCALLTNSAFDHELLDVLSSEIDDPRHAPSHLMIGLGIKCFTEVSSFKRRLSALMTHVRAQSSTTGGAIVNPGDKERVCRHQRELHGIPVDCALWKELILLDRE